MSNKKKIGFYVFFVALILLFLIIYAFPNLTGALKKTVILEYGGIQVTDDVTCYFIRDESVYLANKSGNINYYVEEGEQIRKGVKILDIIQGSGNIEKSSLPTIMDRIDKYNGGESLFSDDIKKIDTEIKKMNEKLTQAKDSKNTEDIEKYQLTIKKLEMKKSYISSADDAAKEEASNEEIPLGGYGITPSKYVSQTNGMVSFYIDGYESEFTPENMTLLSKSKVENLKYDYQSVNRKATAAGEPLYKIVNNKQWYVVFWVKPQDIVKYEKGKEAYLNLTYGQVKGTIYDIVDAQGEWMVIMKFNRYYKELAQARKAEAQVVTADYKGLTIPNESITTENNQTGVYVKDVNDEYVFKPVKIITSDGEYSLVEVSCFYTDNGSKRVETVNVYDEILKKPN
ncbi:HlyD family efflux transporter periplasmic adaptor subunit [Anaerovorax odorimutans]|uniref:HlyD family efflux transporter periplasmic adaptor subunit n=1 Tax=Anaerovorax odorimutans TaxID=109327 RepID=UPI00040AFA78|nr:HlyD family efflux transporter periplasmic adaptor subunit [Anaerovorax odorimutans]